MKGISFVQKSVVGIIFLCILGIPHAFATLTCSLTTSAGCTGTIIWRMSATTNAHAEMWHGATSGYSSNVICCSASVALGHLCSGVTALKLSATTNAHVQQSTLGSYATSTCISGVGSSFQIGYQSNNCTGYDTTLGSISSSSNAQVGGPSAYTLKVCGSESGAQSISFSISTTTVYFGSLSSGSSRYASSTNTLGSDSEVEAHSLSIVTNATNYSLYVQGQTLTTGAYTVNAIGGTNTAPSVGTEQFGLRAVASGGAGTVSSPYAASGFAYAATATTSSQLGSQTGSNNATTTFSIRYLANIASNSEAGNYNSNLTYIVTPSF